MFEAFGLSDPGCVRSNNEDYFISDSEPGIFILADGMGGANAGSTPRASARKRCMNISLNPANRDAPEALEQGLLQVNSDRPPGRRRQSRSGRDGYDSGGRARYAKIGRRPPEISSVGDSRAYLCSNGTLSLLTQDQTWVAEAGARLGLSDDALRNTPCGMSSPWRWGARKSCASSLKRGNEALPIKSCCVRMGCMGCSTKKL